jgi:hypothetical protein
MKHLARTLAAALATTVLAAHPAMADTYQEVPNLPCIGCNQYPKPGLPDILGQDQYRQQPTPPAPRPTQPPGGRR